MAADVTPSWRKSSFSSNGADCVEVAFVGDTVAARDSKDPGGAGLRFGQRRWVDFLAQLKAEANGPFTCS